MVCYVNVYTGYKYTVLSGVNVYTGYKYTVLSGVNVYTGYKYTVLSGVLCECLYLVLCLYPLM